MSDPASPGGPELVHELLVHRGAAEFVDVVAGLVADGQAAGEPTVLMCRPPLGAAVLAAVAEPAWLTLLPPREPRRPAAQLAAFPALFGEHGAGAARLRVVNEMPPPDRSGWHEWRRYEAAVNVVLHPYAVWGLCAYDQATLDDAALADLHATHPVVRLEGRRRHSGRFVDPEGFLATHRDAPPHPVEATPPAIELADPVPADVRAAVAGLGAAAGVPEGDVADLVCAANEVVTNAHLHGRPPVTVRLWTRPGRLTVTVTDTGPGPADPFVGLVPSRTGPGRVNRYGDGHGVGLWLSHQLVEVAHRRDAAGYSVRLEVGPAAQDAPE